MIQWSTKFVVGTSTTWPAYSLKAYLPGGSGLVPNAFLTGGNAFAVAEVVAADVFALQAEIADDDADVADRHERLGLRFDGGEPAVDEIRAVGERLILPAAHAAAGQKLFRVLKAVVIRRTWRER